MLPACLSRSALLCPNTLSVRVSVCKSRIGRHTLVESAVTSIVTKHSENTVFPNPPRSLVPSSAVLCGRVLAVRAPCCSCHTATLQAAQHKHDIIRWHEGLPGLPVARGTNVTSHDPRGAPTAPETSELSAGRAIGGGHAVRSSCFGQLLRVLPLELCVLKLRRFRCGGRAFSALAAGLLRALLLEIASGNLINEGRVQVDPHAGLVEVAWLVEQTHLRHERQPLECADSRDQLLHGARRRPRYG